MFTYFVINNLDFVRIWGFCTQKLKYFIVHSLVPTQKSEYVKHSLFRAIIRKGEMVMKKTSKRLLSLFLALVMVVSSWSIGFTAFAGEKSTDKYWNNTTEVSEAYQSLNALIDAYVPTILGIEINGNKIGSLIGMSDEDMAKATIQDVVVGASPLLMGALSSSADVKTFITKHSSVTGITAGTWSDKYYNYYSYLNGSEDDSMSFYALYQFCENNKNSSNAELKEYCSSTLDKLNILISVCANAEKSYSTKLSAACTAYENLIIDGNYITGDFTIADMRDMIENPADEDLVNGVEIAKAAMKEIDPSITISDPAEALAYYFGNSTYEGALYNDTSNDTWARGISFANAVRYIKLAEEGGKPISTTAIGGTQDLTFANYDTVLGSLLATYSNSASDPDAADKKHFYYPMMVYECLFDKAGEVDLNETVWDCFASSSYEAISISNIVANGSLGDKEAVTKLVNDSKISDDDLKALHDIAVADGWSGHYEKMVAYVNSNDCTLSAYAKELINKLASDFENKSDISMFCNAIATSVSAAKAYKTNEVGDNSVFAEYACARSENNGMSLVQFLNEIMAGYIATRTIQSGASIYGVNFLSRPSEDAAEIAKYATAIAPETKEVKYSYADYAIPDKFAVQVTNSLLDSKIGEFLDPTSSVGAILNPIIDALLESNIDLYTSDGKGVVNNIWQRLYDAPVETVFNLLPVLVILVDEVVVPMLLTDNEQGKIDALINDPTTLLGQFALNANNTKIGLTALHFDLNKIVPSILAWLDGDEATTASIVKTYGQYTTEKGITVDTSKWVDMNGKPSEDAQPEFNPNVYMFTGVYRADLALYNARIDDAHLGRNIYCSIKEEDKDNTTFNTASEDKNTGNLARGLAALVRDVVTFGREAVDDYMTEHKDDKRYGIDYKSNTEITQTKLNNVFVAFPQLIDAFGKKFISEYGVDSDWTTIYPNKYLTKDKTFADGTVTQTYNATLEDFKNLVMEEDSAKVLESLVDILIGNWINALLDILNDTLSTSNDLTDRITLIQGLINSLGGFGEKSIITDVLNGLFDLTRKDGASFSFKKDAKTGYVGLTKESGIFLLANIQYKDGDVQKGIIPLVMSIINGSKLTNKETAANVATLQNGPTLAGAKSAAGTDYSKLLTSENTAAADELIAKLDKILKSLLVNTSINDFTLTANDNILAGVITTVVNYLGQENTNDLIKIVDQYVEVFNTSASNGNVDADEVYNKTKLDGIVIGTYQLLENIVDYLFYNPTKGLLKNGDENKIIAGAITGIVSPDSLAVRIDASKYSAAVDKLSGVQSWQKVTTTGFTVSKGDKESFYDALGQSLSSVAAIVSAILTSSYTSAQRDANLYSGAIQPVLSILADHVGASGVMSVAAFNNATVQEQLIKGILTPVANIISQLYDAPATFLMNVVTALAEICEDSNVKSIVNGAIDPVNYVIAGLLDLIGNKKYLNAKPLVDFLKALPQGNETAAGIFGDNLQISVSLPAKNTIVSLLNKLVGDVITLPAIDWTKLSKATPGEALLLIYGYLVDTVLGSDLIAGLLAGIAPELVDIVQNLSAAQILKLVGQVLDIAQSPNDVYWTFKEYASKLTGSFSYPKRITASEANEAVGKLDDLVANVFPLLNTLGVTDITSLDALLNDKLFTNELLTKMTTGIYGSIYGLLDDAGLAEILSVAGIDLSPAGIAGYLMDKSYGKTYSSAAKTLKKASSWKKVKKLNWGFKDGSAKAEAGFMNGVAAVLRPVNDILAILLVGGENVNGPLLDKNTRAQIVALLSNLTTDKMELTEIAEGSENGCTLYLEIKNGILELTVDSAMSTDNSVVKCDLASIVKDVLNSIDDININIGTNGYESAIVPILEAFICKDVKTYKQYKADYKKAKDNLLIDVLKPIFGLVDDVVAKPADTLTKILPNVAYFIDSNGIAQALSNLLAPITSKNGLVGVLKANGIDINEIVEAITGKPLGKLVTNLLGINVKLTIDLTDLTTCNVQDILIPLVNKLLKDNKIGIVIPKFTWAQIASHGTIKTVKSAAKNDKGQYTTKRVVAKQGEVFVSVLRFVADVLINNATALKKLICGIDAIKKNSTLKGIIGSVFDSIKVAERDDVVRAVFYFLTQNGEQDAFFDYSNFKYENFDFSFGEMDEDFCRKLAPMLDGLVNGLLGDKGGLLGLLGGMVYTDDIINKLATGLYGAIEGVKVGDMGSLTALLAKTGIDFSTANVAALLKDEAYGKTYDSQAAAIAKAGKWSNVKSLSWGVKDRDTFVQALCAVLRPIYGVLDVLLNNGGLNLFNIVTVPGSDGYTSFIVPLMEAFGLYNIKTQYQYREDISKAYDAILLDILNPLLDKVEDILNAPVEMVADILPNLSLFFANNGLLQLIDNLLTPVSALLDAVKPIVNINNLLAVLKVDLNSLLAKIGVKANVKVDVYDLKTTLEPLIGADNVVSLLNGILGSIKIKGTPLGIELPEINWFQLASHGEYVLDATSQAATIGSRISVVADQDATLIAVLRYVINMINYKNNYNTLVNLLSGLLGGLSDSIAGVIDQVLGMLQGDADEVIKSLVDLLQSIAG